VSTITSGFSFLLITVASISLFVGAVGIMAIMLSRVYQRIREIGIMKTLGLTTRDVLLVFMSEAGIIGVIGGLIGIVAGLISTSFVDILSSISSQSSNNISESGFRGEFAAFSGGSATGQLLSFKPIISVEAIVIALNSSYCCKSNCGIISSMESIKTHSNRCDQKGIIY